MENQKENTGSKETKEAVPFYNYGLLDPRPLPEAIANNERILGPDTLGIEVSNPQLAEKCGLGNIDPQHSEGRSDVAAIEVALQSALPLKGARFVTIRADLDSIGSMALFEHRAKLGEKDIISDDITRRIRLIADADKFSKGKWPGPKPLPSKERLFDEDTASAGDNSKLASIGAAIADFKIPIEQRVGWMQKWLAIGSEPAGYRERWIKERENIVDALESGEIKATISKNNLVAMVISKHRAAMSIGYSLAPVVVAFNPEFSRDRGEKYRKFTVAQFKEGYVDLKHALGELNTQEPGWGGTATIIASPQGVSSTLSIEEVSEIVERNIIKRK